MDMESLRKDFPTMATDKGVYLDSSCQSLRPQQVIDAVTEYYTKYPACGGRSVHHMSNEVSVRVDETREAFCRFLGGEDPSHFVFTRNTTEALNAVAFGLGLKKGDAVVTTDVEHNSNYVPWLRLQKSDRLRGHQFIIHTHFPLPLFLAIQRLFRVFLQKILRIS